MDPFAPRVKLFTGLELSSSGKPKLEKCIKDDACALGFTFSFCGLGALHILKELYVRIGHFLNSVCKQIGAHYCLLWY